MNSEFPATGVCNDGAIVATSVRVSADHYISILNITMEPDMINETIECVHQEPEGQKTPVGQKTLQITDPEGTL